MANKVYDHLVQLSTNLSTAFPNFEFMAGWNDDDFVTNLLKEKGTLIIQPAHYPVPNDMGPWLEALPLGSLEDFLNTSEKYAIAFFMTAVTSPTAPFEFVVFNFMDQNGNRVVTIDQAGVESELELNSFLELFPGYSYMFSIILDPPSLPDVEIQDFRDDSIITMNLQDILYYTYFRYNKRTINFSTFMVNIVGIRSNYGYDYSVSKYRKRDVYADTLLLFYYDGSTFHLYKFIYTSFPDGGSKKMYPSKRTTKDLGTAVVMPGFHSNVYKIGRHRGYKALEQFRDIAIYRDKSVASDDYHDLVQASDFHRDRNGVNTLPKVNLHTHGKDGKITNSRRLGDQVDGYSAGCQVVALDSGDSGQKWFNDVMSVFELQRSNTGSNEFDYLLIEETDLFNFLGI